MTNGPKGQLDGQNTTTHEGQLDSLDPHGQAKASPASLDPPQVGPTTLRLASP